MIAGCSRVKAPRAKHSAFFKSHDKTFLEAYANANGYKFLHRGGDSSFSGSRSPRDFKVINVTIEGDRALRDVIMQQYRMEVERELKKAGVQLIGEGAKGSIREFTFTYSDGGLRGLFRAIALVDIDGNIYFDVFIYEHD